MYRKTDGTNAPSYSAQQPVQDPRDNNFNIIRLIASIFVFAGHMEMIRSGSPLLFGIHSVHEMGVWILFLVSGYLITKSWLSDPHPLHYAIRRFFRLCPPFAVMVLIMVFIAGPLVSELGVKGYFQSWFHLYLMNLWFYIVYAQPGVFTNMIQAYVTNGSLWTMPVEAFAYIITPLLACLYGLRKKKSFSVLTVASTSSDSASSEDHSTSLSSYTGSKSKDRSFHIAAAVTIAAVAFDLYLRVFQADLVIVFFGTKLIPAYHLITMYIIGMFFTFEQTRKYLNLQVACIGMCILIVFESSGVFLQYLLLLIILPYFVFSLAFAPNAIFRNYGKRFEPSYGIFLYGYFFQQLVVSFQNKCGVTLSYTVTLILSAIPTLIAAALSYYLIEKPTQRLSKRLLKRLVKKKK